MALNLALPALINAASGALLVLPGLFVASRTKGGRVNLASGVSAIAPVSRLADRIAGKAVPAAGAQPHAASNQPASERQISYRHAVELALRDRRLSREEEPRLFQLAHHLSISPARAVEIQDAVEAGVSPGGDS
ncbi:MAG: hypothetical protein HY556_09480 [Euryarchaeota archaeon]|nr:hypothetical protein [Euryarchaeota archaeon]